MNYSRILSKQIFSRLGDVMAVSTIVVASTTVVFALLALAMTATLAMMACSAEAIEQRLSNRDICDHLVDPIDAQRAHVRYIETAVIMFKIEHKRLPLVLNELVVAPIGNFRSLDEDALFDQWGTELAYLVGDEDGFEIVSYGADGIPGGTGMNSDISSKDVVGR